MMLVEPLFSWRPAADVLRAQVPDGTEVVFEAPEEYQIVGGLAFYARRPITLLAVPGFVPPTYLATEAARMFRWQTSTPLVFVSDPQRRRDSPEGLVPGPFRVVARFGDRWVLANDVSARAVPPPPLAEPAAPR